MSLRTVFRAVSFLAAAIGALLFALAFVLPLLLWRPGLHDDIGGAAVSLLVLSLLLTIVGDVFLWPFASAVRRAAFGESKWSTFVFDLSTSDRPQSWNWKVDEAVVAVPRRRFPYLRHCGIYDEPAVLDVLADWVARVLPASR